MRLQDPVADEAGLFRWFEEKGIDKDEGKVVVSVSDAMAAQDTNASSPQPVFGVCNHQCSDVEVNLRERCLLE
jgi:hypothetical protein